MKKKIIVCLLSVLLTLCIPMLVHAYTGEIKVNLNGQFLNFDQPPVIIDGRTLVPIRTISEGLNLEVFWDAELAMVVINKKDGSQLIIDIGSNTAALNGMAINIDVSARIINGRTMVPLRFVGENLGLTVEWDATTRTVLLTGGDYTVNNPSGDINDKYSAAVSAYNNAKAAYENALADYTVTPILADVITYGDDYIIVKGANFGLILGQGSGTDYMKIYDPDTSKIVLSTYMGDVNYFIGTEYDFQYGTMNVYTGSAPLEIEQLKQEMEDARIYMEQIEAECDGLG